MLNLHELQTARMSNPSVHTLPIAGTTLTLLSQRAIYWDDENTLLVADVHLGKEHVFGRSGIPIPAGSSETSLARLSTLLTQTGASECMVLGDFFHDTPTPQESWLNALQHFLDRHPTVQFSVVAGNHDKQAGQALIDGRIQWHSRAVHRAPFVLCHEPQIDVRGYVLCGHIHPVVRIKPAHQRGVRGPCFWQQSNGIVLPAFGEFTGGHAVRPALTDAIFMTGPDCIIPVPVKLLGSKNRRTEHG